MTCHFKLEKGRNIRSSHILRDWNLKHWRKIGQNDNNGNMWINSMKISARTKILMKETY